MLRCVPVRLARAFDLAYLFDLPDRHLDRMIAAQIVPQIPWGRTLPLYARFDGEHDTGFDETPL